MTTIRRQISNILGISIGEDEWHTTFKLLDRENRLNNKAVHKIILAILMKLEELEGDRQ